MHTFGAMKSMHAEIILQVLCACVLASAITLGPKLTVATLSSVINLWSGQAKLSWEEGRGFWNSGEDDRAGF